MPLFFLCAALLVQPCAATPFQWEYTGSLNTGRYLHTATLLADGRVLVAGGYTVALDLASAELYDPATGTWTVTGSLNTARYCHTATLLPDGKVLVAGGINWYRLQLASAELYDPATGNWTDTGSLNTARCWHTATLLPDGRVLVAGGGDGYAPRERGTLRSSHGNLDRHRQPQYCSVYHTATLLADGRVLVAGG